jgi:hypothetical protein
MPNGSPKSPQLVTLGMAGHFTLDTDGRLYFMDMEQNAILRRTAKGRIQAVVVDPRLMWPDTMAIGPGHATHSLCATFSILIHCYDGHCIDCKNCVNDCLFFVEHPIHLCEQFRVAAIYAD